MIPSREEAWALLCQYNQVDALRRHACAVEGVMRRFARAFGEDEAMWGLAGLLHDLDYEMYPQEHCVKCVEIMRARGWDEWLVRACASHGFGLCTDIQPQTRLEKVLYATDELTGLIGAAALMRPSRSVNDLELKSVMKKYKTKSFAAGCDRDLIERGAAMIPMELSALIEETILGMREVAGAIGLAG